MHLTARAIFLILVFGSGAFCQTLYEVRQGEATFFASAPVSDIRGESNKVFASLSQNTGTVKAEVEITSFRFDRSLMRKHFNDRYMESDKFPKAIFTGRISDNVPWNVPGVYQTKVDGTFLIHGVRAEKQFFATIRVMKSGTFSVISVFKVKLRDHNIEVPTLLFREIADEVEVSLELLFDEVQSKVSSDQKKI